MIKIKESMPEWLAVAAHWRQPFIDRRGFFALFCAGFLAGNNGKAIAAQIRITHSGAVSMFLGLMLSFADTKLRRVNLCHLADRLVNSVGLMRRCLEQAAKLNTLEERCLNLSMKAGISPSITSSFRVCLDSLVTGAGSEPRN